MRKDRKEACMRVGVELFLRRRISKTAKVLENKGLRPFFYAHLSLTCRLNLQADSEYSSKVLDVLCKKGTVPKE